MDNVISSGQTIDGRIEKLLQVARVDIVAVVVIADRMIAMDRAITGATMLEEKYNTKVYSIVTEEDIKKLL